MPFPFTGRKGSFSGWGVGVSRTNKLGYAGGGCLLALLHRDLLSGPLINADETPVQVLSEPGRSPTRKSYMWVFGAANPTGRFWHFTITRVGSGGGVSAGLPELCADRRVCGYDFLDRRAGIGHIGCWAHVRRKFVEVIKAAGKLRSQKKTGVATEAVEKIGQLYAIEQKYAPEPAGQSPVYTRNQWPRLDKYIEDGRLRMDNNPAENAIRPFVVGRKNWLFSGNAKGASACLHSLIETTKANGLEPCWYLRHIFAQLPLVKTEDEFRSLLPQNIDRGCSCQKQQTDGGV